MVECVELLRECRGADGVAREEELDDIGGDVHAAGGVDAGREAEADLRGGGRLVEREAATCMSARRPGWTGLRSSRRPSETMAAVFAGERDGVGDGGDGDELEEAGQQHGSQTRLLRVGGGVGGKQRVCELEGDGRAAEMLVRVRAAGLRGVDDGDGFGHALDAVGQVMVGDDEVEAERLGFGGGGEGADAGVDGDDEPDARGGGFGEADVLDAVALAQPVGHVVGDLGGRPGGAMRSMAVLSRTVAVVPSTS